MLNTVCFHFGHLYQPFDEEDFTRNLDEFYCNASAKVQESRLWYVQFLVVLAFGEALLAPVRRASNTASWTKYFSRAMSLLPDTTALWQDPLLAIEVLALIALYLHSVDMRDSAYCYVCIAYFTIHRQQLTSADWSCHAYGPGGRFASRSSGRATR